MKNKIIKALGLLLASLFFVQTVYADTDANIDGGGGGMGQGSKTTTAG